MAERHGTDARDQVWDHPDLLPDSSDLDEPLDFADRWGSNSDLYDPIAAIRRAEEAEKSEGDSSDDSDSDGSNGDAKS
jgi:hypothetical protein